MHLGLEVGAALGLRTALPAEAAAAAAEEAAEEIAEVAQVEVLELRSAARPYGPRPFVDPNVS